MGELLDILTKYLDETPRDVIEKDWQSAAECNDIGPDVMEYAAYVRGFFSADTPYSGTDADYCFTA